VQRNAAALRPYWTGVADVKPSADSITEIRAFLRAPDSAAEAGGATVSGLLGRAQDSEVA